MSENKGKYIRLFEEIMIDDFPLVGGKNASLGEFTGSLLQKESRFQMALQ